MTEEEEEEEEEGMVRMACLPPLAAAAAVDRGSVPSFIGWINVCPACRMSRESPARPFI
jgi:hypothetical protein